MSAHKAREARRARLTEESQTRAIALAVGAAFLLSRSNGGDPRLPEDRAAAIRAVSALIDEAEAFALGEVTDDDAFIGADLMTEGKT